MNLLYPEIPLRLLPRMLGYAVLGGALAGLYGVLHDQITYSISPEYFTRVKFLQFHWADFGLPPKIFVAEIGFLATCWVGFFAAWFLARVAVPALPDDVARRHILRGFLIVFALALAGGVVGYVLGIVREFGADYSSWMEIALVLGISDIPDFVRVAYIHNAGYLGGLTGVILAIMYVRRLKRTHPMTRAKAFP
jgi:hypothetical protein